jgi:hypothetical protein
MNLQEKIFNDLTPFKYFWDYLQFEEDLVHYFYNL